MGENTDQKNFKHGHFSRTVFYWKNCHELMNLIDKFAIIHEQ